jgi:hypothetical protein
MLGWIVEVQGHHERARELLEESLRLSREEEGRGGCGIPRQKISRRMYAVRAAERDIRAYLRSCHRFYTNVRGVLPQENRSEITQPLPETLRGAIRQRLNTHLIGACREVFAHPIAYITLGSPGDQSFRERIWILSLKVPLGAGPCRSYSLLSRCARRRPPT